MINSKIILLAEGVVEDIHTNSISIFNIFEEISVPDFPVIIPKIYIFNMLERDVNDPDKIECVFRMQINEEEIFFQSLEVSFQDKLITRSIILLGGIPIPAPGLLQVTVLSEGSLLDAYEVRVNQTPQPAVQPSQG